MSFGLKLTGVPVIDILEHSRTISGRRDPATGTSITTQVNLGWFMHLEFDGGVYAFGLGTEKPDLKKGDTLTIVATKD